jgi:hypothetical protein
MANPFAPPQIDFSGNVENLIGQYRKSQLFQQQQAEYQKQKELQAARKDALSGLMSGEDPKAGIMKLMGMGDIQGAQGLATAYKTLQGPQMTPYQEADLALRARQGGETPDIKNYLFAQSQGQQPTGATPTGETKPVSFEEWQQQKKAKPLPPKEVLENKYQIITGGLDAMIQNIDDLTSSPYLGSVTGWKGAYIPNVAGSPAANLSIKQKQLMDQAKLGTFQDLKDASTSGTAGFGRLAVIEFNTMNQRISALDSAQDEDSYRAEVKKLRDWAVGAKARLKKGIEQDYGEGATATPQEAASPNVGPAVPGATQISVGPNARPIPSPDKITLLRQYAKNPEAIKAFDELYGAGAAAHFLSGGQ